MKEYKVLTMKDGGDGAFNPEALEKALNKQAKDGYQLITSATADVPSGIFGEKSRQEIVLILERDKG